MLERFIRLRPLIFSSVVGENTHEFLVNCQERLYNLRLLSPMGLITLLSTWMS